MLYLDITGMQQLQEMASVKLSAQPTDSDGICKEEDNGIVVPAKFVQTGDGFEKTEHSWFAMSQIPTELSIQVQDITFHVHKYPLVSKCGYFGRIELQPSRSNLCCDLRLDNFPGGSEAFEIILKFCYGLQTGLNVTNISALRCASEFLEMTEALEDGNLISKSEAFFTFVVLSSWRESITVLRSCETLSPWAENLQIVRRCCDSIAWKIYQETSTIEEITNEENWWFDDLATLRIDYFTRIITALKAKGMQPAIIGSCIMYYAEKHFPRTESDREQIGRHGLQWNIFSGWRQDDEIGSTREQRMIVESLVSILPSQKEAVSCKFLLNMLKLAMLYSASPALISELEKRVGLVLESADVNDLLIPSYGAGDQGTLLNSTEERTMHNTDVVQRILDYFFLYEQQQQHQQPAPLAISKLLDNYLAEIAKDPKLSVTKFELLARSLPEKARACDDGLYRAIDTYLKTHPSTSDHDRRRICKVMNCGKLSLDACAHAAQNDRLPLRTVIQVLFSEQVKIRAAIQEKIQTETADNSDQESNVSLRNKEVKALKIEVEKLKTQMTELQREHSELQQEHQKPDTKQRNPLAWALGWRKIRKSALFNLKIDGEETDKIRNRSNQFQRGTSHRRQSY